MCNFLFCTLQVALVFFISANANPIIIRSAVQKNQGQQENLQRYGTVRNKGIANFEADEGFNKENEQKFINAANAGRYGEQNAAKQDHIDQNQFNKGTFYQNGGGEIKDHEVKTGHKKGHHKTGFHNSYHKDEHGSNSSFYDDGSDQGDDYILKTHKGAYGDAGEGNRRGGDYNAVQHANQGVKQGQYDDSNRYDKNRGNRQNYNRNIYYDDREQADRRHLASDYGAGNRYAEDHYKERPFYHVPYPDTYHGRPLHSRQQQIKIYEDPRYVRRVPNKQYDDDYVDVKPRLDYRQNRRPYDYYD